MDGYVTIGTELDVSDFDRQIEIVEKNLTALEKQYNRLSNDPFASHADKLAVLSKEILSAKKNLVQLNKEKDKLKNMTLSSIQGQLSNIGKGIDGITKKVVRWGFAVFGIRSAFMFVRSAINTIANDDEQLKADIDYMKSAIAYTLEPVVRGIVNLVKQLMFYIGYIIKAWTGKNIFENANKSLKNATGSAKQLNKELNKTVAGFDEMNVLQDTSSSSSGDAGAVLPSFDLTAPDNIEPPAWLTWIVDHKDEVIAGLMGIAGALMALNLGFGLLKSLGIGLIIAGIAYAIEGLLKYLEDPSFANLGQIIQGIGIAIIGLGIAFFGLPAIIAGAVVLIVGTIVKYWDEIKTFFQGIIDWLYKKAKNVGGIPGKIIESVADMLDWIIKSFDLFVKGIKDILDGVIKFVKSIFSGDIKGAIDGLLQVLKGMVEMFFGSLGVMWGALFGLLKTAFWSVVEIVVEIGNAIWGIIKGIINIIISIVNGAINGVINMFLSIPSFVVGMIQKILGLFGEFGRKVGDVIGGAFKGAVNGVLGAIETILNTPIKAINSLIKVINKIPGINLGTLQTFKLPRLATGGIINQPGRGVPIGSAIGGERGQEGVLPLTDSQQMALLGEAIGKYITVDITNITNLDGRQIARKVEQINQNNKFVLNR